MNKNAAVKLINLPFFHSNINTARQRRFIERETNERPLTYRYPFHSNWLFLFMRLISLKEKHFK